MTIENRKTKQIASSLILMAQLPDGDALVQILGNGNEDSNEEALGHWVETQHDLLNIQSSDFLVKQLLVRLSIKFNEFNYVLDY